LTPKTDTNNADFPIGGAIQQAPDGKAIATQIARLALAGHHVIKGDRGDYTCCKYGLSRYCANFAELEKFAQQLGVK
jgi:hypothetical protein